MAQFTILIIVSVHLATIINFIYCQSKSNDIAPRV